ncbi:unnamed protein product [Amoebophrya sp. A120]|nr:unnamed protein product [Amoebophrya sp. A120]|eukprot:GSA120T00020686001.1
MLRNLLGTFLDDASGHQPDCTPVGCSRHLSEQLYPPAGKVMLGTTTTRTSGSSCHGGAGNLHGESAMIWTGVGGTSRCRSSTSTSSSFTSFFASSTTTSQPFYVPQKNGRTTGSHTRATSTRASTAFLRFPETYPSANMPPEAAARKWAVIAADAQQQAQKIAAEQSTLEQMSSSNMAKLQTLNQTAQTAAEASQRAAAASVAKDLGMSVAATPVAA